MPKQGDPYYRGGVHVGTWEYIGGRLVGVVDKRVSESFTADHELLSVTQAHPKPFHRGQIVNPRDQPHGDDEVWCVNCTGYHAPGHHRYV